MEVQLEAKGTVVNNIVTILRVGAVVSVAAAAGFAAGKHSDKLAEAGEIARGYTSYGLQRAASLLGAPTEPIGAEPTGR